MPGSFRYSTIDEAIEATTQHLQPLTETELGTPSLGRVLKVDVKADRDSPAADVSAMDGYGAMASQLAKLGPLAVNAESICGSAPPEITEGGVIRIFTGAIVPQGCDVVIRREDVVESGDAIEWSEAARKMRLGSNIRRQGENLKAGDVIARRGDILTATGNAALTNFGINQVSLFPRIKVGLVTTGDEVVDTTTEIQPWQLRNSNATGLMNLLSSPRFAIERAEHATDSENELREIAEDVIEQCDVLLLTGGVSMGDYDYVPKIISDMEGEVIFHRLPIRPGKPLFVAHWREKLIVGLPGNPVSALVNARRFVVPMLEYLGGVVSFNRCSSLVSVDDLVETDLPLHRLLLVRCDEHSMRLVPSKGSGDLVAMSRSDGFVEVPIGWMEGQAVRYFSWQVG
ncbi:MAG: molybdopterin molybdotransferase MoeA [Planctomycetota bacterium]